MLLRKRPEIVSLTDDSGIGSDYSYDTSGKEESFQLAISLKNYRTGIRNDPRYVQSVVGVEQRVDGVTKTFFYPLHPCTKNDFAKFYPVEARSKGTVNQLIAAGGLQCLDWEVAKLAPLRGHWRTDESYTAYDVQFVPCSMRFTMPNGTVVEPRDDCIKDKEKVMEYLGETLEMMVYYNKETFR